MLGLYSISFLSLTVDVNECIPDNGGCEQVCVNDYGSYHCECRQGFMQQSNGENCIGKLLHHNYNYYVYTQCSLVPRAVIL